MMKTLSILMALLLTAFPAFAGDAGRGRQLIEAGSYEQAFYELLPLAEAQDPAAQYLVGGLYLMGQGVPQDPDEARKWMIRAAHNGHAEAAMALAQMAAKGFGSKPDTQQSLFWYRKAAEQGVDRAQYVLGGAMAAGKGMSRDAKGALQWLERSAKQGNADAQLALAQLLQSGGPQLKPDPARALYWYAVAARSGHKEAEKPRDLLARQTDRKGKLALSEAQRFVAKPENPVALPKPAEPAPVQPPPAKKETPAPQVSADDKAYPPLPAPRHMGKSSYKIQVASGSSQAEVSKQASKLRFEMQDLLGELEVAVVYGEAGFTALMGPFPSPDQADALCAKLLARGVKTCSPVPP